MVRSKALAIFFAGLMLALLGSHAQAQQLYRVNADANGNLSRDQQAAFDSLMLRLTGDEASKLSPLVVKAKKNISPYVQQYSYADEQISVLFNETAVNQLFKQANLRLWGAPRPQIVVWFAHETDFERQLLAARDQASWRESMQQQAKDLAVPLLFPVMDLEDSMAVSVNDIWGQFDAPVFTASQRYASPLILTVKQYQQGAGWQAQWRLLDSQTQAQIDSGSVSADLRSVAGEMVEDLAARLAERYGVVFSDADSEALDITLSNVSSMSQFVALESYLKQQAMVASVQLTKVVGTDYSFTVELLSAWEDLQAALALHPRLTADPVNPMLYHFSGRESPIETPVDDSALVEESVE